jgi:Glycosyl hydrolases family 15
MEQVEEYREKLDALLVDSSMLDMDTDAHSEISSSTREVANKRNFRLVPELYIVPLESIDAEKAAPGSQERVPNANIPLVWAQSLHILGNLVYDDYLSVADIDPIGRRHSATARHDKTVVQIVLISYFMLTVVKASICRASYECMALKHRLSKIVSRLLYRPLPLSVTCTLVSERTRSWV